MVATRNFASRIQLHCYGKCFYGGMSGIGHAEPFDLNLHVHLLCSSASPGVFESYGFHSQESVDVSRRAGAYHYVAVLVLQLGHSVGEQLAEIGAYSQSLGAGFAVIKNRYNFVLEGGDLGTSLGFFLHDMLLFGHIRQKHGQTAHHASGDEDAYEGHASGI